MVVVVVVVVMLLLLVHRQKVDCWWWWWWCGGGGGGDDDEDDDDDGDDNDDVHRQRVGIMVADSTHGFWDQSSIRAVTHAKKGDQLFLRNVLTSAMEFYAAHNQPYTSFSGFLVQAD